MKFFLSLIFLLLSTWGTAQPAPLPLYHENYQQPITIGRHSFLAEIVDTPKSMQKGMMFRPHISENHAMLFIYPNPQPMTFWMKNMQIALDILFFDQRGVLQEIKSNVPPCQTPKCPVYPAKHDNNQFVVEIQAGLAAKQGITIGDKLHEK